MPTHAAISYPRRQQLRRLRRVLGAGAGGAVALRVAAGAVIAGEPVLGAALVIAAATFGASARRGATIRSRASARSSSAPAAG